MKHLGLFLSLLFCSAAFAHPPHLDLEMGSSEYRALLKKNPNKSAEPAIKEALRLGERLSRWIAVVNARRTPETAIRLTSEATRRGIPIDKPNMYSPSIIGKATRESLAELPDDMKKILLSTDALPEILPVTDQIFITHARKIDKNYQSAARYKTLNVYRPYYIQAAVKDVRGLYYLQTNNIGEEELRDVRTLPSGKVQDIKDALRMICINSTRNSSFCAQKVKSAFMNNTASILYKEHISASQRLWDSFFKIPYSARRRDISWSASSAVVPFNTPEIPKFIPYLRDNIEDEFRWKDWGLRLNFGSYRNGPYLKFEAGVVPHVNGLGGNEIVMDSNQPIEEYESQWIIRHEFGHVLGLPDCYHEFYDVSKNAYVNYQLDITDLMCSRAGNMNERIYLELKKAYE